MKTTPIFLSIGTILITAIAPFTAPLTQTAFAESIPASTLAQAPQNVTTLKGFNGAITAFTLSPDGNTLIVAGGDGTITALDARDQYKPLYSNNFSVNNFSNIAISPDGKTFVAAQKQAIGVFDVSSGNQQTILQSQTGKISAVAISPDNQTLISTSGESQTIQVWNLADGSLVKTIGENVGAVTEAIFSPDGQYLITGSIGNDRYIQFWDTASWQLLKTYPQQPNIFGLAITPNSKKLLTAVRNYVNAWDITTGEKLWATKGPSLDINMIALSPDGRTVATANKEGTIMLFDVNSGKLLKTLQAQQGWVLAVAFSADGQYLYGGGEDKTIKIWDLRP